MWQLYDEILESIPRNLTIQAGVLGSYEGLIRSELGSGLGTFITLDTRPYELIRNKINQPIIDTAKLIKSFNFAEACLGQAAINAYYNSPSIARMNGVEFPNHVHGENRLSDPFIAYQNEIKGRKVAVVGHFPYLEKLFSPICDLRIINPFEEFYGDYPKEACEYILPECDYVFLTCATFANKSLPRLLEISQNAKVTMVGPSTPIVPLLFRYGIHDLSSFIILDNDMAYDIVSGMDGHKIYTSGQKVSLKNRNGS